MDVMCFVIAIVMMLVGGFFGIYGKKLSEPKPGKTERGDGL
jgi:hypothetical protein